MSRPTWIVLFVLVLCGTVLALIWIDEPPGFRGRVHPELSTLRQGGDGLDRHRPILLGGWLFGCAIILCFGALIRFGAPVESLGVSKDDLLSPDMVIQIGMPPRRIDLLTGISGVEFVDAWGTKVFHRVGTLDIPFLGREALVANKRATGRAKDVADLEILEGGKQRKV